MNTHHLSSTSGKWIPHIQMPHTPPNKEALLTMAKHLNIHPIFCITYIFMVMSNLKQLNDFLSQIGNIVILRFFYKI